MRLSVPPMPPGAIARSRDRRTAMVLVCVPTSTVGFSTGLGAGHAFEARPEGTPTPCRFTPCDGQRGLSQHLYGELLREEPVFFSLSRNGERRPQTTPTVGPPFRPPPMSARSTPRRDPNQGRLGFRIGRAGVQCLGTARRMSGPMPVAGGPNPPVPSLRSTAILPVVALTTHAKSTAPSRLKSPSVMAGVLPPGSAVSTGAATAANPVCAVAGGKAASTPVIAMRENRIEVGLSTPAGIRVVVVSSRDEPDLVMLGGSTGIE